MINQNDFTEDDLTFYIPGNTPSSKNNRQWTGRYFIVSKNTKLWRERTAIHWGNKKHKVGVMRFYKWVGDSFMEFNDALKYEWGGGQRMWFQYVVAMLDSPIYVELTFIRESKHKFDYINLCQTILDEMVTHDWITDDNADNIKPYFGDFIYDPEHPGTIIKLFTRKPILI